ncbi:medium chain dehydrogenase/reductase family protein [Deinococcus sp.]|uniref:medium chain dehydrogenase/reductase family protein n=1 Tax=Deinococcus sp. TaxID=47478 RepID=UPI003CC69648
MTSPIQTTEIVLPGLVPPSGLLIQQRTLPAPGAGQALIRMEASGISFAEQSMRRGRYPGQPRFPFVPGYDVVGTALAVGPGVSPELIGRRVAAAIKTGGWATHLLLPAADLVAVPAGLSAALAETLIVNGVTAWQMLHRQARVQAGQTILVHGASSGVGTVVIQLALHAGLRIIGTAAPRHHAALRASGIDVLDSRDPDLSAHLRTLAPAGLDAIFDHLGLASARRSYALLAPGGSLVLYGMAAVRDDSRAVLQEFLTITLQLAAWKLTPDARRASFYNFWAGHTVHRAGFRRRLASDLRAVLDLAARGTIAPQIAAEFPLARAAEALELAESRTVRGKVILTP